MDHDGGLDMLDVHEHGDQRYEEDGGGGQVDWDDVVGDLSLQGHDKDGSFGIWIFTFYEFFHILSTTKHDHAKKNSWNQIFFCKNVDSIWRKNDDFSAHCEKVL